MQMHGWSVYAPTCSVINECAGPCKRRLARTVDPYDRSAAAPAPDAASTRTYVAVDRELSLIAVREAQHSAAAVGRLAPCERNPALRLPSVGEKSNAIHSHAAIPQDGLSR